MRGKAQIGACLSIALTMQTLSPGFISMASAKESVSNKTSAGKPASGKRKAAAILVGDAATTALLNAGNWPDLITDLKGKVDASKPANRDTAWLAFALLYQGKYSDLKELKDSVLKASSPSADSAASLWLKLVESFALISEAKLKEADKTLSVLGEDADSKVMLLSFARAAVALKTGKPEKAAEYAEKCVDLEPSFAWGWRTLGFIQEKNLKQRQLAERAYEKALALEPKFREVSDHLTDLKLSIGDYDGAIAVANDAIEANPKDGDGYYRLAQIYLQQRRLKEALDQLDKAVKLKTDDPRYYRARAQIFRQSRTVLSGGQNQLDGLAAAVEEQKKAVELSKDKVFELVELASMYEAIGNKEQAIDNLKVAIQLSPGSQAALQRLVNLLKNEKRSEELAAVLKQASDASPKSAKLKLGYGEALKDSGKFDLAIEQFKLAANLDNADPTPHKHIASIYLDRRDYPAAAREYTHSLSKNPNSIEDLIALGYCFAQNNDYMQAETALVTSLALLRLNQMTGMVTGVGENDVLRSLGMLLLTEGRYSEASTTLSEVVTSDKDKNKKLEDQFLLAQAQSLRDRKPDGLQRLKESFDALPSDRKGAHLSGLVETYLKLGKTESALAELNNQSADDLKTSSPALYFSLLRLTGQLDAAKRYAEDAGKLSLDSEEFSELLTMSADLYTAGGDIAKAQSVLRRACEVYPKNFIALEQLARLFLKEKKYSQALNEAKRSLEINPYHVPSYLVSGEASLGLNKTSDAELSFQKAAELLPASVSAHRMLSLTYEKLGKKSDAEREQQILANMTKNNILTDQLTQ